jgi:hypothetical protein
MCRFVPPCAFFTLAAALLVTGQAGAQQSNPEKTNPRRPRGESPKVVAPEDQRVTGVIATAEPIMRDRGSPSTEARRSAAQRLTIQTDIDWNEWARDQVGGRRRTTPREEAERGANSTATKGEPRTKNTDIVVDIGPSTRVLTRTRTDLGDPPREASATRGNARYPDSESLQFRAEDLKPGLFVEVNFARKDGRNVASTVTVIHPVSHASEAVDPGRSGNETKRQER